MKKAFVILLVCTILLGLVACKKDTEPSTSNPETETENIPDIKLGDSLPEKDFKGANYTMAIVDTSNDWDSSFHIMDGLNGDALNDARYYNILNTETRFNVDIEELEGPRGTYNLTYIDCVKAGDKAFHTGYFIDMEIRQMIMEGILYDIYTVPYVDLTRDYWNPNYQKYATINNRLYGAIGSFDTAFIERAHCLLFNKVLNVAVGNDDLYQLVREGKWTIDNFFSYTKNVLADINGDGEYNMSDRWGYLGNAKEVLPNFWISAGLMTVRKDENDIPYYALDSDENFITYIAKIQNQMYSDRVWCWDNNNLDISPDALVMFKEGNGLFMDINFKNIVSLRDSDVDFGILPYPKKSEAQSEYYTRVEAAHKTVTVPITQTGDDLEMIGIILEALYYDAHNTVLPEYIETYLKWKNTRDAESQETINIIINSMVFDFGDTWWCGTLRDGIFYPMFMNNNQEYGSVFASAHNAMEAAINEILPAYGIEQHE